MDRENPPGPAPLGKKNRIFGWGAGIVLGVLVIAGLIGTGCALSGGEPAEDDSGTSNPLSSEATISAPTITLSPTPSEEDLCVLNPECRLDVESEAIRRTLELSSFNFNIEPRTTFDGYQLYSADSDPPAVLVEWLEHEGVVWVWVAGPEPATVLELDDSFTVPWSSLIRHITSDVAPGPWDTDVAFWIMNTYSDNRVFNGVLIEVDYLAELKLSTINFRKAP